ncbi:MAG: PEP-CTERM sorting domain-containing protein [Verrucomicrobiaceae bacterium]|nr:MAG: PEP-CTERM sorting domain-containing protein [Verrucomicrobiaceae bacterium]
MKKLLAIIGLATASLAGVQAQVLLNQDFASSTSLSSYISATPDSGQWNAISTSGAGVTISTAANNLSFTRATANTGTFSRTSDFSPTPTTMIYRFDLSVSGNSAAQTSAAVWQVGSGFGTANSAESNANTYARFALNFTATDGTFQIRDIQNTTNSGNLSGTQSIMWVLNNSGSSFSYTSPLGSSVSVANDTADIWAGTSLLFNDVAVTTGTQSMTDLKFAFTAGTGSVTMDNFLITVPEPKTWVLIGIGSSFMLWNMRRRRRFNV